MLLLLLVLLLRCLAVRPTLDEAAALLEERERWWGNGSAVRRAYGRATGAAYERAEAHCAARRSTGHGVLFAVAGRAEFVFHEVRTGWFERRVAVEQLIANLSSTRFERLVVFERRVAAVE